MHNFECNFSNNNNNNNTYILIYIYIYKEEEYNKMSVLKCKGWDGTRHDCYTRDLKSGLCPLCLEKLTKPEDDYKKKVVFRKKPSLMGLYDDESIHIIIDIPKLITWKIDNNHEYIITLEW